MILAGRCRKESCNELWETEDFFSETNKTMERASETSLTGRTESSGVHRIENYVGTAIALATARVSMYGLNHRIAHDAALMTLEKF